jgi:hypothetical protein
MSRTEFLVSSLDRLQSEPFFHAQSTPSLVLDPHWTIRAVDSAYAAAVNRPAEDLLGLEMFDAFPDNPADPQADGVANLSASFERTAQQRKPHRMLVQRYDIPAPTTVAGRSMRVWRPVNTPIIEQGSRVHGLLHQVQDITSLSERIRIVLSSRQELPTGSSGDNGEALGLTAAVDEAAAALLDCEALANEVVSLRRAMQTRASIEQAKGIIMGERRCTPDEAFAVLRKLSSDSNVKLADVARALVYRSQKTTP